MKMKHTYHRSSGISQIHLTMSNPPHFSTNLAPDEDFYGFEFLSHHISMTVSGKVSSKTLSE